MDITRAAIEKNRVTTVSLLVVLFAGMSIYGQMPRNEDPGFIIRAAQVLTFFPGASPERVELLVSDKLEKAIEEIPELDFVNSTSRTGLSVVVVNILESERDMRPIWDNVRRKVERASRELPDGIVGPFVNDEFGDVFGTIIALTGEGYTYAELKEVADQVRNELLNIDDAAKVEIHGAQEERVVVSTLIPMTMIMSLIVMDYFAIGLDQMSLSALIIALGLLVDNAIVVSESGLVRLERGQEGVSAAIDAVAELKIPLLTSSLTTSAAFLPIYLAESTVGEYTAPLFEVVSIALICSWILSLTMIPMLCVQFMRAKEKSAEEAFDGGFYRAYRSFLHSALKNRA